MVKECRKFRNWRNLPLRLGLIFSRTQKSVRKEDLLECNSSLLMRELKMLPALILGGKPESSSAVNAPVLGDCLALRHGAYPMQMMGTALDCISRNNNSPPAPLRAPSFRQMTLDTFRYSCIINFHRKKSYTILNSLPTWLQRPIDEQMNNEIDKYYRTNFNKCILSSMRLLQQRWNKKCRTHDLNYMPPTSNWKFEQFAGRC